MIALPYSCESFSGAQPQCARGFGQRDAAMVVYDPACGSGLLLLKMAGEVKTPERLRRWTLEQVLKAELSCGDTYVVTAAKGTICLIGVRIGLQTDTQVRTREETHTDTCAADRFAIVSTAIGINVHSPHPQLAKQFPATDPKRDDADDVRGHGGGF